MRPPNPLLYVDSVTVYGRSSMASGTRGDLQFPSGTGVAYAHAIVTMRTDMTLRDDKVGQPVGTSNWDIKILSATDPAVGVDDLLVDQLGRKFIALSKSTSRLASDWIIHCKSND